MACKEFRSGILTENTSGQAFISTRLARFSARREENPSSQTEKHRRATRQAGSAPRESVNFAGGSVRPPRRVGRRNHSDGDLKD